MTKRKQCSECSRPLELCLCSFISSFQFKTNTTILQDLKESKHPFNTARFANMASEQVKLITTDKIDDELIKSIKKSQAFILFKNEKSLPLNINQLPSKQMLVLDGTWKKARKIYHEWPLLQELPCFHLVSEAKSLYTPIRKSCGQEHLSTLEAIGLALKEMNELNASDYEKFVAPLKELIKQQSLIHKKML